MELARSDFTEFFASLHDGFAPFAWQQRLLDRVLEGGRWPEAIDAPTSAGKTAAIDVHVFAQALCPPEDPARAPRRLSMVVARRVLVDDQHEYACRLAERLRMPDTPLLAEIARRLWRLRAPQDDESATGRRLRAAQASPLVSARLRGGAPPARLWREHPTSVAVICATPDMWGSRLLFRGYGASASAWPREAGLLAFDSVVVVDEAHLSRQLLCTARRVVQLASVGPRALAGRELQVVGTTATQNKDTGVQGGQAGVTVGVNAEELDSDETLRQRLSRSKPLTLIEVDGWGTSKSSAKKSTAKSLADEARRLHGVQSGVEADDELPNTVGCFVNSVPMALETADELRRRGLSAVVICGQVRPCDLARLQAPEHYPGLLTPAGNRSIDVIVATQSLEVGVDIDLAAAVSELAPGSALAQRAGRVNRRGRRISGPFSVVVPAEPITNKTASGPYSDAELGAALDWLGKVKVDDGDASPWVLSREYPPPQAKRRRELYQRPELADAWHWARTSEHLAAEPELDLWLAESFEDETSIGLLVRERMPSDAEDALEFVRDLPPREHEVFCVPYTTARNALSQMRERELDAEVKDEPDTDAHVYRSLPVVRVRGDEVELLDFDESGEKPMPHLRPGDLVVLDSRTSLFSSPHASRGAGFSPQVVLDPASGIRPVPAEDALMALSADSRTPDGHLKPGQLVLRIEPGLHGVSEWWFEALAADLAPESLTAGRQHALLANALELLSESDIDAGLLKDAISLLGKNVKDSELTVHRGPDGPTRVLLKDVRGVVLDEGPRQLFTTASEPVALAAHQSAVGARARSFAAALGLMPELCEALAQAGAGHDAGDPERRLGKADRRFQLRLGNAEGVALAKSAPETSRTQALANNRSSGLPSGWRHEQGAVIAYLSAPDSAPDVDRKLAARLIGTHHGYGRSGFPLSSHELGVADEHCALARELFDLGGWEELIERTQREYGVWGCAYLEALLRAADGQVSEEGDDDGI